MTHTTHPRAPLRAVKGTQAPTYLNASLSTEERVADLLARMTVDEKAAQMMCVWQHKAATLVGDEGRFDCDKARAAFENGVAIGQVGRPSDAGGPPTATGRGRNAREMAELTNEIQKFFL